MEHGRHLVDLVDENGVVIGSKPRRDIDKDNDVYHAVYTVLVTPVGQVVLARIPERKDLPNLYVGQLGVPAATIRRTDESPMAAAQRSVARELYIDEATVVPVGGGTLSFDDGRQTYMSFYYMIADCPETFSSTDINELVTYTARDLHEDMIEHPERFAPTLLTLWEKYYSRLPL